jgi:hypothetical protein
VAVLVWIIAAVGLAGVVAALRLPRPQHRIALAVVGIALALVFWPIECSSAMGLTPEGVSVDPARTWCTSAVGLRLPIEGGIGIVLGGVALLAVVHALVRRRHPPS